MFTLNCKGRLLVVDKPLVMGIINVTPDSFYEGSRYLEMDIVLNKVEQMVKDGATIVDIGGQSTRPGSIPVGVDEELKRVIDVIRRVRQEFPEIFISIDTYFSVVAREAVEAGADIVNDISGGSMDAGIIQTVASLKVPYVLMHMKGVPQTMQAEPQYEDVTREVLDFLVAGTNALQCQGVKDVIVDPGFGFGKTIRHNFELLHNLSIFKMMNKPILLGISRKSTIYKTLGITADEALNGTTVLNTIGLMNGASIVRVHDVKEAREAVELFACLCGVVK